MENKSTGVGNDFEVLNGLTGMNRDVILHLCIFLKYKHCIKSIFGISQEYLVWKNHHYFVNHRKNYMAVSFRQNPSGLYIVRDGPSGLFCSFTAYECRTVFVNRALMEGVFRWTVQIFYEKMKEKLSSFYLGASPPNLLLSCDCCRLGYAVKGTSSFWFFKGENGSLDSCLFGVCNAPRSLEPVPDGSVVSIEVDCAAHTLSFFVGSTKVPHMISDVRMPLHFGMSGVTKGTNSSFASVSLHRLPLPTPSAIVCTEHKLYI